MCWKHGCHLNISLLMKYMPLPAKFKILYLNPVSVVSGAEISLLELLRNINTDIFEPLVAAMLSGIPIICHTRNILGQRPFRRMFLNYADVLMANSRAVAASYAEYLEKSDKLVVIHNGVNLNDFSPVRTKFEMLRKKLGLPDNAFVIGHIARICPE